MTDYHSGNRWEPQPPDREPRAAQSAGPPARRPTLSRPAAPRRHPVRWLGVAAAGVLLATTGGAAAWLVGQSTEPQAQPPVSQAPAANNSPSIHQRPSASAESTGDDAFDDHAHDDDAFDDDADHAYDGGATEHEHHAGDDGHRSGHDAEDHG